MHDRERSPIGARLPKGTYLRAKENYASPPISRGGPILAGDIGMIESYGMFIDGRPTRVGVLVLRLRKTLSMSTTDLARRWEKVA